MATAVAPTNNNHGSETEGTPITLKRLRFDVMDVPIVGTTPLIMQRWSQKARDLMLAAQQGSARTKKPPKDPVKDFEESQYRLDDGSLGFPATGFKAAISGASRQFDGITLVQLRRTIFVEGEGSEQLVPLDGEARMREDMPRNANGIADIRHRAEIWPWAAVLKVRFLATALTPDAVVALVDAAGQTEGVGAWRPSSPKSLTGTYGCFQVVEGF